MEDKTMEDNNNNQNNQEEHQQPENKSSKRKRVLKEICEGTLGLAIWFFLIFFTIRGVKSTIHSARERKEEHRKETIMERHRIDWGDYEYLITPPKNIEDFLYANHHYGSFVDDLNKIMQKPLEINRPYNIAWDGDTLALAKRHIAPLRMPLDLDSRQAPHFIDSLKQNPELRRDFFEWVADCIQFNNYVYHLNYDYWMEENEYDAMIGRVVDHLKSYLTLDGLHYDRIYEETCKNSGMEQWFDRPNRIVEEDGAYYCATKIVDNPYRHFEVFLYRLVEEYGVDAGSIYRWLDDCPLLSDDYEISTKVEAPLPPPPLVVSEIYFDFEGDTIWLSDVAMEWMVELRDAAVNGFEDGNDLTSNYLDFVRIIEYHFMDYYFIETDNVVRAIEQKILEPQIFEALVGWMAPSVTAVLEQMDETEKQNIREGLTHLLEYLHNGNYDRDLEYERLVGPSEVGFAIEYAPNDFIIHDGEIYEGLGENPFREDEVRLFVALQSGIGKERFEKLLVKTLGILNKSRRK